LTEFYYHKIRVVASEQSLLDENFTKKAAAKRLDVLRTWCIKRNRLREARFLTYFRIGLMKNHEEDRAILEDFLRVLKGKPFPVEEAQTHLDVAACLIRSDSKDMEAFRLHFEESERLFTSEAHKYGLLDLADVQLSQKGDSLSPEEKLEKKLSLAEAYFKVKCYQQGIKCLIFSIQTSLDTASLEQTQKNIERVEIEVSNVGGELLKQAVYILTVCQALVRAPEYGYALKSLETYLASPPVEIGPKNHGLLVQFLAMAYFNLGNASKAVASAKMALEIFCGGESYVDKSDAAFNLAFITMVCARQLPSNSDRLRWSKEATELLKQWADLDRENKYQDGEQEKCLRLAFDGYTSGISGDGEAVERAAKWFDRAQRCNPSRKVSRPLNSVVELEIAKYVSKGDHRGAIDVATNALNACRTTPHVTNFEIGQSTLRVAYTLHAHVRHLMQNGGEISMADMDSIRRELFQTLKIAWDALQLYRASGVSEVMVTCAVYIGSLIQDITTLYPQQGHELLKAYLPEVEKVEEFCDSIRRSSASTNNVRSLLEKRNIVSSAAYRKIYAYSVQSCLLLEDLPSAWMWIQKGKARALSDLFGVRALLPEALLEAIRNDSGAQVLYEQERLSTEIALQATPQGYIGAARMAEAKRMQMKTNPLLARILEIREAFNIGFETSLLEEALQLTKIQSQAVKYIDWFISTGSDGASEKIILMVRQLDSTTYSKCLNITVREVEEWIQEAFNYRKEAEPRLRHGDGNRFLSRLNNLVDGLEQFTSEDDLLVLSPSGLLNKVPLHGLSLGKRRLIDRNLIIYSSSAAVFRQCQTRATSQATKTHNCSHTTAFLGLYEEPEFLDERAEIFDSMERLGTQFHGEVRKGPEVTKSTFRDYTQKVGWLHYHGHAVYAKKDVLKSGLILSDGTELTQPYPERLTDECKAKDIAVPEIFDLDMTQNAPHYTIIACDSGTQDIAPGDEPIGLIPALLYAGATSVLGSLWPIPSSTGRMFSEKFYSSLQRQINDYQAGSHPCVLNIAVAVRDAVREMMNTKESKAPFFWAPFVLHGAWFHVLRQESNEKSMGRKTTEHHPVLHGC
jgi:CHAT domain-containing protein